MARLGWGEPIPELVAQLPDGSAQFFERTETTIKPVYQMIHQEGHINIEPSPTVPRVIWLGGSSIRGGNPHQPKEEEVAHQVGAMLGIETVNLAAPGMDSGLIGGVLPQAIELDPDAVVIYTGHNDIGNSVYTNRYNDARIIWTARLRMVLGKLRMFQLLEATLRGREVVRFPTPEQHNRFRMTYTKRKAIRQRFKERLTTTIRTLREHDIPVVVATVISNPIAPSLEWTCPDALAQLDLPHHRAEAFDVRMLSAEAVEAQLKETGKCHDLLWLKARLNDDREAAMETLEQLRDDDSLPVRADRKTIEVIRETALSEDAQLVDIASIARSVGQGIEPPEWFNDPVHFSPPGQQAVAAMFAPVLAQSLGLEKPQVAIEPPVNPSLKICGAATCRAANR